MTARLAPARGERTSPPRDRAAGRPARPPSLGMPAVLRAAALVLVLALRPAPLHGQDRPGGAPSAAEPAIPAPVGFVNDRAGRLDEGTVARLEAFLDQLRRKTGAEFAVLIVPSTAPWSPSEYKVRVFERWGLGRKGVDDGLLMLVAIEEREVRFETGYGLEGTLPDGLQSRIFRREMAPRLREGDWAGAVTAGVLACASRIADEHGVTLEWDGRELRYREPEGSRRWPLAVFLAVLLLSMLWVRIVGRYRGSGRRRGGWRMGPGPFGGWGGGFGGFGGSGGGRFGGGSFGGFGGGASGGGGGGGKW